MGVCYVVVSSPVKISNEGISLRYRVFIRKKTTEKVKH